MIATSLQTGERLLRYYAHHGPLNSIAVTVSGGRELVLTGGDDGIARVFDPEREGKEPVVEFDDGQDVPVTAVAWSGDGNQCFVGGVDNAIKVRVAFRVDSLTSGMGSEKKRNRIHPSRSHRHCESTCQGFADGRSPRSHFPLPLTSSLHTVSTRLSSSTTSDHSRLTLCASTGHYTARQPGLSRSCQSARGRNRTVVLG